jgi:hypothetical protein
MMTRCFIFVFVEFSEGQVTSGCCTLTSSLTETDVVVEVNKDEGACLTVGRKKGSDAPCFL